MTRQIFMQLGHLASLYASSPYQWPTENLSSEDATCFGYLLTLQRRSALTDITSHIISLIPFLSKEFT